MRIRFARPQNFRSGGLLFHRCFRHGPWKRNGLDSLGCTWLDTPIKQFFSPWEYFALKDRNQLGFFPVTAVLNIMSDANIPKDGGGCVFRLEILIKIS